jgi:serine protease DegQ
MSDTLHLAQLSGELSDAYREHKDKVCGVGGDRVPQRSGIARSETQILTSARYAEGGEHVYLRSSGGDTMTATVVGWDGATEIALLETPEPHGLPVFEPADTLPAVGSLALSLGMPGPAAPEMRLDMIRGVEEGDDATAIHTDGTAVPGFAGGALVTPAGRLAGVLARDPAGFSGYAVPASRAFAIAETLAAGGGQGPAYLGIQGHTVALTGTLQNSLQRDQAWGLLLVSVDETSPAADAGMMVGDILVALNGVETATHEELFHVLSSGISEHSVEAEVLRGGIATRIAVTPAGREGRPRDRRSGGGHGGGHGWARARRGEGMQRRWRGMGTMG